MKSFSLFTNISPCGHKCKHCYATIASGKKVYKTLQEVKHIIDLLSKLKKNKCKKVSMFLNDDPFTHKDIIQILDYMKLKEISLPKWVVTNGLAISKRKNANDIIKKYKEAGVKGITVSLFGLEKNHDDFVGLKGSYTNVIKAIGIIKEHKLDFSINLFLTSTNLADVLVLKKIYEKNARIAIFGPSSLLENKENKKYWAKYKDILCLIEKEYLYAKNSNIPIKDYLSVKEVLEKINDDNFLLDNLRTDTENIWVVEINYNIYQSVFNTSLDKIGNINFDSIEEIITRSSFFSYIYNTFYDKNLVKVREMLKKLIDVNDEKVYFFWHLLTDCFRKDVKNSLREYWNKLPIEKLQIFAEQKVSWNYVPKIDTFIIKSNSDSWHIKGTWGKVINEILKGNNFYDTINNVLENKNESPDDWKIVEDKFLELIFKLHEKGYIYIAISG